MSLNWIESTMFSNRGHVSSVGVVTQNPSTSPYLTNSLANGTKKINPCERERPLIPSNTKTWHPTSLLLIHFQMISSKLVRGSVKLILMLRCVKPVHNDSLSPWKRGCAQKKTRLFFPHTSISIQPPNICKVPQRGAMRFLLVSGRLGTPIPRMHLEVKVPEVSSTHNLHDFCTHCKRCM